MQAEGSTPGVTEGIKATLGEAAHPENWSMDCGAHAGACAAGILIGIVIVIIVN